MKPRTEHSSNRNRIPTSAPVPVRDAIGLGLRPVHIQRALYEGGFQDVDFFEVIAENFIHSGPIPKKNLKTASEVRPVFMHGTSLNLLGADSLDVAHLGEVQSLLQNYNLPYFTEHLCWSRKGNWKSFDLLPTPHNSDFLEHAVSRCVEVREYLDRPFGLENLSSYVSFTDSSMSEFEFYTRVIAEAGIWYMLDINNIYVSAVNHGFDPVKYLEAVDWDRVLYVHLAGHSIRKDGLRIDTHDHPVCDEVWDLYQKAWVLGGPFPTMVEWDDNIPEWETLLEEAHKARKYRERIQAHAY